MFGYDVGISGGVTSMPEFLREFFPTVYKKNSQPGLESNYSNMINYGTSKMSGPNGWRISLGLAAIPALLLTMGSLIVTDTPNSLIAREISLSAETGLNWSLQSACRFSSN
ncbi:hypothetical protein L3X38_002684 [Prunus dulcis]|uniref:Uncharacterized protein n=1 Tax=Prunus dulcis TaxID=3755 RepID=A0AAD4ZKX9_PRUDU|nr:hypothetical protein L3X38_002684 [Prunus dulcis]